MSKLKPCPFCGGEVQVVNVSYKHEQWFVTCDNDFCTAKPFTTEFDSPQKAIDAWNTRAERTCTHEDGFCSSCGLFHVNGIAYCPYCGAKVVDE